MYTATHNAGDNPSVFSQMQVGDQIHIQPNYGWPESSEVRVDIIIAKDGMSALTAGGICLICMDEAGLTLTGIHFNEGQYEISPAAAAIQDQVRQQREADEKLRSELLNDLAGL